jgi:hypothetical protein
LDEDLDFYNDVEDAHFHFETTKITVEGPKRFDACSIIPSKGTTNPLRHFTTPPIYPF